MRRPKGLRIPRSEGVPVEPEVKITYARSSRRSQYRRIRRSRGRLLPLRNFAGPRFAVSRRRYSWATLRQPAGIDPGTFAAADGEKGYQQLFIKVAENVSAIRRGSGATVKFRKPITAVRRDFVSSRLTLTMCRVGGFRGLTGLGSAENIRPGQAGRAHQETPCTKCPPTNLSLGAICCVVRPWRPVRRVLSPWGRRDHPQGGGRIPEQRARPRAAQ
jgi:hypothetical protein